MPAVRDLRALPKAELHLHTVGALRPGTLIELAAQAGLLAPDPRRFTSFAGFQLILDAAFLVTYARPENLQRVVREIVTDAAADGVVWIQPHFDPYAYPDFGLPDHVLELVLAAGREEGARRGVGFGLTLSAMRPRGPEAAEELARFGVRHAAHGASALGLVGDEAAFGSEPFARAFAIATDGGLTAAPHAGELSGAQSVRTAVELLGSTRIAHGVRAIEDPAVLDLLSDRGVSLDVSLSSNRMLGVFPDVAAHPLPALLAAGVSCSLGADDPLTFGPWLAGEYELARSELGLTDEQLAALARTSIESSDAPTEVKSGGIAGVDAWLAAPA